MIDIYTLAFRVQSEFPGFQFETIVNLILKHGYNKTILLLLERQVKQ